MRIHASHPKRAHASHARTVGLPGCGFAADIKRRACEIDAGIRLTEVGHRRNRLVPHGKHRLDQPADSCGGVQMANIRLDAAQGAEAVAFCALTEGASQRCDLDRIAERRCGAVRFHIGDGVRADSRHGLGSRDSRGLAIHAWSHVADLRRAIIGYRKAPNHGVDSVAVGKSVFHPLQQHHSHAVPEDGASRVGVEGTAMSIARSHAAFLIDVAAMLRKGNRDTSGQRHIALIGKQALARLADRDQRRCACALYCNAGTTQIQLVRYP